MQVLFHDFNEDGFPDLFVANDTDANGFYLNRGNGTFKVFSGPSGLSTTDGSMGIAIGDINKERLGTAREAITGSPPLPNPTVTAAKTAIIQKIQWSYMIKLKEIIKFRI